MKTTKESLIVIRPVAREREWVNTKDFSRDKVGGSNAGKTTLVVEPDSNKGMYSISFDDLNSEELAAFKRDLGYTSQYGEDFLNASFNNPFWVDFNVVLLDEPNFLNLAVARDRLKYYIIKNSSFVADSFETITPESLFYIEDTEEKAQRTIKKGELKEKAYVAMSTLTADQKVKLLKVYGERSHLASPESISARIFELIEDNPAKFLEVVNMSKEKLAIKNLIFDLLENGVIREKNGYIYDTDELQGSVEQFEYKLSDPKQTDLLQTYRERLEAKRI
jgi:hypothetical protein